ncbi:hypothetical protein AB0J80_31180 [Actinoplanes sp. NPDC049548]|uniref:hypothetical protein n=1 Tax=Actinoplanes sp. NPDC049548 TaxID=3155152 RepID=UPI0034182CBD
MSFGTYARKVRDRSLPYGRRVNALAGCVQLYRPIGYLATFAYLEHLAGPLRRDEYALLRAVDALATSRAVWLKELDAYAARRQAAKRAGRRSTRPSELNPSRPACWYGDSRRAAVFTLGFLLRNQERSAHAEEDVVRLARSVLEAPGDLSPARLEQVDLLRNRFERLQAASGWPDVDWPNWVRARQSLWMLHQICYATA